MFNNLLSEENIFDGLFEGLFDTGLQTSIGLENFLILTFASLLVGAIIAIVYAYRSRYTKSFLITLGILPAVVCIIILMVNGNLGAGVAVAGAFSLVRFRSAPGTAKEITVLFLAMASGLIMGMGYIAYSALFTIIICVVLIILQHIRLKPSKHSMLEKTLKITIPEDLNYSNIFNDIFEKYAAEIRLVSVKSTNMGSMFKLSYEITEKKLNNEKEMLDELRARNGNLEIAIFEREINNGEL